MELFGFEISNKMVAGIFATVFLVSMTVGAQALPSSTQNVSSTGFIYTVGVGIYGNQACTINVTSVDWGTLMPGNSITKTAYIKNSGSSNVSLSLATNTWVPSTMQQYITMSWNATNYVLGSNQVVTATFTLTISQDVQGGSFAFNILITGQGI
jgi:hypothetical protein